LRLLAPTSGKIIFAEGFEREHLGYLPQRIELSKNFPASVGEVVLTGRLSKRGLRPFFSKTDKAIAAACLQRLHAGELAQRNFSELSGGQQQRVLLARALCAAEQLLVLDEPAAGLDPNLQAELEQIILSLNREQGMTVIMVSHDVQSALLHAGKILHLDTRQVFFGSTTEYRKSGAGDGFIGCVHEVNASSRVRASEQ
jgi:zinc transport system ATP-binding protein